MALPRRSFPYVPLPGIHAPGPVLTGTGPLFSSKKTRNTPLSGSLSYTLGNLGFRFTVIQ